MLRQKKTGIPNGTKDQIKSILAAPLRFPRSAPAKRTKMFVTYKEPVDSVSQFVHRCCEDRNVIHPKRLAHSPRSSGKLSSLIVVFVPFYEHMGLRSFFMIFIKAN